MSAGTPQIALQSEMPIGHTPQWHDDGAGAAVVRYEPRCDQRRAWRTALAPPATSSVPSRASIQCASSGTGMAGKAPLHGIVAGIGDIDVAGGIEREAVGALILPLPSIVGAAPSNTACGPVPMP